MAVYRIYTYSILYAASAEFAGKVPYIIAVVEDETGKRRTAFVEGYREGISVSIGDELKPEGTDEKGRVRFRLKA